MKLYTKNGCVPCQRVKEYLLTRPALNVEVINCSDYPEKVMEFSNFSKTFPTLVTDWGFVTNSEHILEYLATAVYSQQQPSNVLQSFDNINKEEAVIPTPGAVMNISNTPNIARIPEPDCEACQ